MAESRDYRDIRQYRIEYLNLIQGNVARMAGNSALMKGFAATMMAAMLGMCISDSVKWYYIAIMIIPLLAFIRLDVYYLQLEKRYRNLYALVAAKDVDWSHFSLDLKHPELKAHQAKIKANSGFFRTLFSVSVIQFYVWFIILAVLLIILIA